ncbi:MAG TPA: hypothetical protein VM779_13240 [Thermoanaerobaculia bacterium]|nr:hypothetical protein [Thermoanaerobaculia bacterium]
MPRIEIDTLPDTARVWIFGISPSLEAGRQQRLLASIDGFLENWAAHGQPIRAARHLQEGSFLIIGVDEAAETSGCSIDKMFGTLRQAEDALGVSILDSGRVFVRHGDGRPEALTRADFRQNADAHTIVFDTNADQLGRIRSGEWEKPAAESWHRGLLAAGV